MEAESIKDSTITDPNAAAVPPTAGLADTPEDSDMTQDETDQAENPDAILGEEQYWKEVSEGAIPITKDEQVLKFVVKEGTGETPSLHARCLVHYTGRYFAKGEIFVDTKTEYQSGEPQKLVAGRDCVNREAGLNVAVSTMKLGEVARIYILDPKYGYGDKGSFSFPSVPPSAKLVYEMELMGWEPVGEGEQENTRTYEDKLEAAERRRLAGNEMFRQGQYKEALAKYAMALSFLDEDFMMQLDGFYLEKAEAVKVPIHLNMAACQLRTGDQTTAVYNCGQVLMIDPKNVKALFRRGVARHQLGQTEAALKDLEEAAKIDPNDVGIQKEIKAVKQTIKQERKAEAALFRGTLGPAPTPSTSSSAPATTGGATTEPSSSEAVRSTGTASGTASTSGMSSVPVLGSMVGLVQGAFRVVHGMVGWLLGYKKPT